MKKPLFKNSRSLKIEFSLGVGYLGPQGVHGLLQGGYPVNIFKVNSIFPTRIKWAVHEELWDGLRLDKKT